MGAIILLLLIFLFTRPTTPDVSKYNKQKREIDSLSNNIKALQKEQIKLNKSLLTQYAKIDSLNKEITTTEKELIQTRIYYGNKIKNITSSSPAELNEFFTERY
jgi:peptidoglycan hydrolase CwlO-like protein